MTAHRRQTTLAERLDRLLRYKDFNAQELSLFCGLGRTTVSTAMRRNGTLSPKSCKKISYKLGCDYVWLMHGIGDWGLTVATATDEVDIQERTNAKLLPPSSTSNAKVPRNRNG